MNSIQQGANREHPVQPELTLEADSRQEEVSRGASTPPYVFQRLPTHGVPEAAAREWARADAAGYAALTDPDQREVSLAMIALNRHGNAHYADALLESSEVLHEAARTEGINWLRERTNLLPADVGQDRQSDENEPVGQALPLAPAEGSALSAAHEANIPAQAQAQVEKNARLGDPSSFDMPETLRKRYLIADDKFYFRDDEKTLAFVDKGKKLQTELNDPEVARSMVALALAKNWSTIKIRGSAEFKREAWLAAVQQGMEVEGYRPTKLDKARLEEWREMQPRAVPNEIEQGAHREHAKSEAEPAPNDTNDSEAREQAKRATPHAPTPNKEDTLDRDNLSKQQRQAIETLEAILRGRGDSETAIAMAVDLAAERFVQPRVYAGKIIDHGPAPYEHKKDNEESYYLTLQTKAGERTVWGVDLPRALEDGNAGRGDEIVLAFQGKKAVTVMTPQRDADGKLTGKKIEITADRNSWDAQKLETLRQDVSKRLRTEAAAAEKAQRRQPVVNVYDARSEATQVATKSARKPREPDRNAPAPSR